MKLLRACALLVLLSLSLVLVVVHIDAATPSGDDAPVHKSRIARAEIMVSAERHSRQH